MDFATSKSVLITHLNSETQLLLQFLTLHPDPQPGALVLTDGDAFLHLLESHRLTTVFCQHVNLQNSVFATISERLYNRYVDKKLRLLSYTAELCSIVKLLKQHDIEAVALKGPLLGKLYQDDYTQRECNDLDILVSPSDVDYACQLLLNLGYQFVSVLWNSPKQKEIYKKTFYHYNLYHPAKAIQVELHWRLNVTAAAYTNQSGSLWSRLISQKVGGVDIPSLSSVDNFIYLCTHGCIHEWKRLFWVRDIAQIIDKEGPAFLIDAYQQAVKRKLDRYVLAGCFMAAIVFDTGLPRIIEQKIRADPRIFSQTSYFLFAINQVTSPYQSPLSSVMTFKLGLKKMANFHRSTYYLGGFGAVISAYRTFFVNPDYWAIYSFSDNIFALNYLAAPFLWLYSAFTKSRD